MQLQAVMPQGCDLSIFTDMQAAWQDCQENEPDLLLIDGSALRHDGRAMLEKFRALHAQIPVLMLVGEKNTAVMLGAMQSGVSDVLCVPLDDVECHLRIVNLLELRQCRQDLAKRTSWLADEVNQAYLALEQNAVQAQEISDIAKVNLKLKEADRSKNDFLAHVSHDLRAPLATILGYSGLLASSPGLEAYSGEFSVINRNANHLLGVIDELLEFARNTMGMNRVRLESVDLHELIEHVMQQAQSSDNRIVLEVSASLPRTVLLDSVSIKRVLSNLMCNAVKFTRNGTVTLRVSAQDCRTNSQTLLFEVIDTGVGIAQEELARIFEPFYRATSASVPGTGLGLAICRQLTEAMGGRIAVSSVPGKGSHFSLHLICPSAIETGGNIGAGLGVDELKNAALLPPECETPDEACLKDFQRMAEAGLVSSLEAEAHKLADIYPAYARFVLERCAALEIEEIAVFCKGRASL